MSFLVLRLLVLALFLGLGGLTLFLCHFQSSPETFEQIRFISFLLPFMGFIIYFSTLLFSIRAVRMIAALTLLHIGGIAVALKSSYPLFSAGVVLLFIFLIEWQNRKVLLKEREVHTQIEALEFKCNEMIDEQEQLKQKKKALEHKRERFFYLKEAIRTLSFSSPSSELAQQIVSQAARLLGKEDSVSLFLLDEDKQRLQLQASNDLYRSRKVPVKWLELFHQWVLKHRQPLLIENTQNEYRLEIPLSLLKEHYFPHSVMVLPLVTEDKIRGLLSVYSIHKNSFTVEELRLLAILASSSALTLANARLYCETEKLANRDGLTQLYVPRYFYTQLNAALTLGRNHGGICSLLMMDIDLFKKINDSYGHLVGDNLLSHLAKILNKYVPQNSVLCRYGGEEFALMLPGYSKEEAYKLAEQIRYEIESTKLLLRRVKYGVTLSIGVASFPEDGFVQKELLKKADQALYKAKEKGRNQVCCA